MEQVPCDPEFENTDRCDVFRKMGRCFIDNHHLLFPRRNYKQGVERDFRNLEENRADMCRNFHNLDHAIFSPPDKPDRALMELAVEEDRNRRLHRNLEE